MEVSTGSKTLTTEEISSGVIVYGSGFASTAALIVEAAKQHNLSVLVLDRFGELTNIASELEDSVVLRPVKRRFNPLKPFGSPGVSVLPMLYAAAYSVGRDMPNAEMVRRAQDLVLAGKEPTGVSLAADLLEQEIEELELLARPSSVQYLGNKEDFDMEAMMSHDVFVDMSLVQAADEATLICLSCLLRARALLDPGTELVMITHPDVFFATRSRASPANVQFLHDLFSSLLSRGINLAVACQSPELIPSPILLKMFTRVTEKTSPPRVEISSPSGRRSVTAHLHCFSQVMSEDEIERRMAPFVIKDGGSNLPPWLVSDFGDEAEVAAEVVKHIAEKQPSLDEAIGRANDMAKGVGGSVVGRLVRLRYAIIEQAGPRSAVVLAEKGKRLLNSLSGDVR